MYRIPLMSTVLFIVEPLEKVYLYEVGQSITRPHIANYQIEYISTKHYSYLTRILQYSAYLFPLVVFTIFNPRLSFPESIVMDFSPACTFVTKTV